MRWARYKVRLIGCLVVICFVFYKIALYRYHYSDGFFVSRVQSHFSYNPEWDVCLNPQDFHLTQNILSQPFYYLGKGCQCYVFISQDGQFILKLFKYQRMRVGSWAHAIWLPSGLDQWRKEKIASKEKKLQTLFQSMRIAYSELKEESGIVAVHLNKTKGCYFPLTLWDKAGLSHILDMDSMEFVVQRKADLIFPTIQHLMNNQQEITAQKRIDQILNLFLKRAKKGIIDTDSSAMERNNFGFLEDRAIYIDTGTFVIDPQVKSMEGFLRDLERLNVFYIWLKKNYPSLATYFERSKCRMIQSFQEK